MRNSFVDQQIDFQIMSEEWMRIIGAKDADSQSVEMVADIGLSKYFYIESEEALQDQVGRWKKGLKWYNDVVEYVDRNCTQAIQTDFKIKFSCKVSFFLKTTWNSCSDKFNIDECVAYLGIVDSIVRHTDILKVKSDVSQTQAIVKAACISIEATFMNNISDPLKTILKGFWSRNNFEFFDSKIISNSIGDIMRMLQQLQSKLESLASSVSKSILQQVCVQ